MTAATFAHLPLQVGGAVLARAGRAALWLIARYMRAPLTHTAIAALVATTALAGTNALYGQSVPHPAPMFGQPVTASRALEAAPVLPVPRPAELGRKLTVPAETPVLKVAPAAPAAVDSGPISNADVFEIQRKLEMLKLFSGTIDGIYGPQTAKAIRLFEEANGKKPTGMLTREIVNVIKAAPFAAAAAAQPAPAAVVEPQPQPVESVIVPMAENPASAAELPPAAPAGERIAPEQLAALAPLEMPAPLSVEFTGSIAPPADAGPTVLGRPVAETPEEALEMAADTAGEAIETIIAGVTSMAMTRPGNRPDEARSYAGDSASLNTSALAPADAPRIGVALDVDAPPPVPGTPIAVLDTLATPDEVAAVSVSDPVVVARVQRGLASLGFLHGPADGVAGEATAKAIRNFETYFNYRTTGRITPELLDLLIENGASI